VKRTVRRPKKADLVAKVDPESGAMDKPADAKSTAKAGITAAPNASVEARKTSVSGASDKAAIKKVALGKETVVTEPKPDPNRRLSNRRTSLKTEELMNYAAVASASSDIPTTIPEEEKPAKVCRKRKRHPNRKKRPYTRKPCDIDEFLGLTSYNTFEKVS
jgi:hypothetical protein